MSDTTITQQVRVHGTSLITLLFYLSPPGHHTNLFDICTLGIIVKEEDRRDGEVTGLITLNPRQDERTSGHGVGLIAITQEADCGIMNDIRMVRIPLVWKGNHC